MKNKEILEKIIAEEGNCSWVQERGQDSICATCPMSKLKVKSDGNFYSCVESLNATELSEAEQNIKYKEAATRLLLDISIEDLLKG